MTRHSHRRTIAGAPRLIRRASLIAVAAMAVAAAPSSAATGAQLDGDTLQIFGDNGEQTLALVNQPTTFALDIGNDGTADFTFDRSTFSKIEVDAKGGNDRIDLVNGGGAFDKPITVDGGAGNDTLRGAAGAEKLLGGSGDDDIDGNIGADTVDGGSGNDRIEWDPGDGSDTVDGASGTDALDFNGSNIGEQIGVTANGARARLTRNVASIDMDLGSLEQIRVRTLGGSDAVTVGDLRGTGVRTVSSDLRAFDGGADGVADNVIVQGTDAADRFDVGATSDGKVRVDGSGIGVEVTSAETQDNVDVDTLGETDMVVSGVSVPGPGSVTVDGGDGNDTSIYKGTGGDDKIDVARNGTDLVAAFVDGGGIVNHRAVESLEVRGYDGADAITAANGIGTLTALTVDGGADADTLRGGDGDDTVLGGDGDDIVAGGRGADTARLGHGDAPLQWHRGDGRAPVRGESGRRQGRRRGPVGHRRAGLQRLEHRRADRRLRAGGACPAHPQRRRGGARLRGLRGLEGAGARWLGPGHHRRSERHRAEDQRRRPRPVRRRGRRLGGHGDRQRPRQGGPRAGYARRRSGRRCRVPGDHADQRQRVSERHAADQHAGREGRRERRSERRAPDHAGHRPRRRPVVIHQSHLDPRMRGRGDTRGKLRGMLRVC